MNRAFDVTYKDNTGRKHDLRIEVAHDALCTEPKVIRDLAEGHLKAFGLELKGEVTAKPAKR